MFQDMMEELALVEREQARKRLELTAAQQKEKTLKVITYDGVTSYTCIIILLFPGGLC